MAEIINKITPLPPAPDWQAETPALAEEKALNFTAALPPMVEELNEAIAEINNRESTVIEVSEEALSAANEAKAKSEATEALVNEGNVAHITGDETINGVKTFVDEPILPSKGTYPSNTATAPATEAQILAAMAETSAYIEIITSSKTWVSPKTGRALVILIGGGGSGCAAFVTASGGGGGAGYAAVWAFDIVKGQSCPCVIGAGGAGKSKGSGAGNTGGSTSFNGSAVGGGGGGGFINGIRGENPSDSSSLTVYVDQNSNNGFTSSKNAGGGAGLFGFGNGSAGTSGNQAATGAGASGGIILIMP